MLGRRPTLSGRGPHRSSAPLDTSSYTVDLLLLAHINQDAFLYSGAPERSLFRDSLACLEDYLNTLEESEIKATMTAFLLSCRQLLVYEEELKDFQHNADEREFQQFTRKLLQDIAALAPGQFIYFPGGWVGQDRRDVCPLLYEFKRDTEGNVTFTVHNNGLGLTYHEKHSTEQALLYNPQLTYLIPADQWQGNNVALSNLLKSLVHPLLPGLHNRQHINASYLYDDVFSQFLSVKGQIVRQKTSNTAHWLTAGHAHSASSHLSLHSIIISKFSNRDEYRRFIYGFKRFAFDSFIEHVKRGYYSTNIQDPYVQDVVQGSLRHMLRLLNATSTDNPDTPLFDDEKKREESDYLISQRQTFRAMRAADRGKRTQRQWARKVLTFDFSHHMTPFPEAQHVTHTPPQLALQAWDGEENLLSFMQRLNTDCSEGVRQADWFTVFEQLEQFFLNLPLPSAIQGDLDQHYASIRNKAQAAEFYSLCFELQRLYFECAEKLSTSGHPLPRMILVKMSAITVIDHVNSAFPLDEEQAGFHGFIRTLFRNVTDQEHVAATYLANHDPVLDDRLLAILSLYKAIPQRERNAKTAVSYYHALLANNPSLVERLEGLYRDQYAGRYDALHEKLQGGGLHALYYLIDHGRRDAQFEDLNEVIRQQMLLEKALSVSCKALWHGFQQRYNREEWCHPYFVLHQDLNNQPTDLAFYTIWDRGAEAFTVNGVLKLSIYPLPRDADESTALSVDPIPHDNIIQLRPARFYECYSLHTDLTREKVTAKDVNARELLYLRKVPQMQIKLTLDYFMSRLDALSERDLCHYVESNLFQAGLLMAALAPAQQREFFTQFDTFVNKKLDHYKKIGKLEVEAVFFVHLSTLVNLYAAKADPQHIPRLQKTFEQLSAWMFTTLDEAVFASLHQYRLLCAMTLDSLGELNSEQREAAYVSYFVVKAKQNHLFELSEDTRFRLRQACQQMKRLMQRQGYDPSQLTQIAQTLRLPLDPNAVYIEEEGAVYLIKSSDDQGVLYVVNPYDGQFYKDSRAISATPQDILQHPIWQKLNITPNHACFMSEDQLHVLIESPEAALRFIKPIRGSESYFVQMQWQSPGGELDWYELIPNSRAQGEQLGLYIGEHYYPPYYMHYLPSTLRERDTFHWSNASETLLITDGDNQPVFYSVSDGEAENNAVRLVSVSDGSTVYGRQHEWTPLIEAIEDSVFTLVTHLADKLTIALPRYGLTFEADFEDTSSLTFSHHGIKFTSYHNAVLADSGIAHLSFQADGQSIVILPVQPFVQHRYDGFIQDLKGQLPEAAISQGQDENERPLWQYSGMERAMVLKLEAGQPVPETPEQALFLAYLYLSTSQPLKAWAMLTDCDKRLGGLIGSPEELRLVQWLTVGLTEAMSSNTHSGMVNTPSFVACKLKAFALLTTCLSAGQRITFPEATSPEGSSNARYEILRSNGLKNFYLRLNAHIYETYVLFQPMRPTLPAQFTLTDAETSSLLGFYHDNLPGDAKPMGALGYEWVQYQYRLLKKEYEQLKTKESSTAYEEARCSVIEACLANHEGVAQHSSRLDWVAVDLELPDGISLDNRMLSEETKEAILRYKAPLRYDRRHRNSISETLASLEPQMEQEIFIQKFPCLLATCQAGDDIQRETLLNYTQAVLLASRHTPLSKQATNVPLLCNVLYRLLYRPDRRAFLPDNYEELIAHAQTLPAPELRIPQLLDDSSESLVDAQTVWDSLPAHQEPRTPALSEEVTRYLDEACLFEQPPGQFEAMCDRWRTLEAAWRIGDDLGDEQIIGQRRFQALQELKVLADEVCTADSMAELERATKSGLEILQAEQAALEAQLLALANAGPSDPGLKQAWEIDIASEGREALSLASVLRLFLHADTAQYAAETGLSEEQTNDLHGLAAQYLSCSLRCQQLVRVQGKCQAISEDDHAEARFRLAETLFAENVIPIADEPAVTVFQYYEDKLLRAQQKKALTQLLSQHEGRFSELIEKITMGGGKSKVIVPTLAEKKANGENLVVVEVPRSMLHTNHIDLNRTSNRLFDQRAHLFEFNRGSDSSAEALEKQYRRLSDVMINKDYLVTTGESVQSNQLKYLEILFEGPPSDFELSEGYIDWCRRVNGSEALVKLFLNRCDLLIDEVHLGLWLKNKLNYTLGKPGKTPVFVTRQSVALYQFLQEVSVTTHSGDTIQLDAVIKNHHLLDHVNISDCTEALANQLIENSRSPLQALMARLELSDTDRQILCAYLKNQTDAIPAFVKYTSQADQQVIVFYKEQITSILPFTLGQPYKVKYGPSKDERLPAGERVMSIPYRGKDKPRPDNRHGHFLETVNYTIQSMLMTGVPYDLMVQFLKGLQTQENVQFVEGDYHHMSDTPVAMMFHSLTGGLTVELGELDVTSKQQMREVHQLLYRQEGVIYQVLRSDVLPNVPTDTDILHSDAYNRVDMVRSCQGISGTPFNYSTYHPRLSYDAEIVRGDDAYIVEGIRDKAPSIISLDYEEITSYFTAIFEQYGPEDRVRAFIEASAVITDLDNEETARALARFIHQHPEHFYNAETEQPIQYILFYDDQDRLSAVHVSESADEAAIVIGTSDPDVIAGRLHCPPEGRFTFYDQAHTVGADIAQHPQAKSVASVAPDLTLSAFNQAALRMRGLIEGQQSIDLVVTADQAGLAFDDLIEQMKAREATKLAEDHFFACLAIMKNSIRTNLLKHMFDMTGPGAEMRKRQFLLHCKEFFVESAASDFVEACGRVQKPCATEDIFHAYRDHMLNRWRDLLTGFDITVEEASESTLSDELDSTVQRYLEPGVCTLTQLLNADTHGREVDVQQAVDVDLAKETAVAMMRELAESIMHYEHNRREVTHIAVREDFIDEHDRYEFKSLSEICPEADVIGFSPRIHASRNFYQTYEDQEDYMDVFAKPVHGLLFKQDDEEGLTCILLSQQELAELTALYATSEDAASFSNCWISTTQHTCLLGEMPADIQSDEDYRLIIEQLMYFKGEFDLLIHEEIDWLREDSSTKLTCFAEHLMRARGTSSEKVIQLRQVLSGTYDVFAHIAAHPTENYEGYDWKRLYSSCSDDDIAEFNNTAAAFMCLQQTWWDDESIGSPEWLAQQYVPLMAVGYLQHRLEQAKFAQSLLRALRDNETFSEEVLTNTLFPLPEGSDDEKRVALMGIIFEQFSPMSTEPGLILLNALLNEGGYEQLAQIMHHPRCQATLERVLLENGEGISRETFNVLLTLNLGVDVVIALAQCPVIETREDFDAVYEKAKAVGAQLPVSSIFLKHPQLPTDFIEELLHTIELTPDHVQKLLQNSNLTLAQYLALVEKSPAEIQTGGFVAHPFAAHLEQPHIRVLLDKSLDQASMLSCLDCPQVTDHICLGILDRMDVEDAVIAKAVDKLSSEGYLEAAIEKALAHENSGLLTLAAIARRTATVEQLNFIKRQDSFTPECEQSFYAALADTINAPDAVLLQIIPHIRAYPMLRTLKAGDAVVEEINTSIAAQPIMVFKNGFDGCLEELFEIKKELSEKAQKNKRYEAARDAANTLLLELGNASRPFFETSITEESKTEFLTACSTALENADETLKDHRGTWYTCFYDWFRGFVGVLATVTVLPALIVAGVSKHGYVGTFFSRPQTNSSEVLAGVQERLVGLGEGLECRA